MTVEQANYEVALQRAAAIILKLRGCREDQIDDAIITSLVNHELRESIPAVEGPPDAAQGPIRVLAQELVDRYTKRQPVAERHGGCGWCGGLPHSIECLVGRMETASAVLDKADLLDEINRQHASELDSFFADTFQASRLLIHSHTGHRVDFTGEFDHAYYERVRAGEHTKTDSEAQS